MKKINTACSLAVLILGCAALLPGAWTSKQISSNAGDSQYPAAAASGSTVYVVWEDKTPGNYEIYFRRSVDSGANWETAVRMCNTTVDSQKPDVAACGVHVYVVWHDATPGTNDIYFRHSADRGATWQSAKRITFTAGHSVRPAVAAYGASVYVTWADDTSGNYEIYFRRSGDNGATWNPVKRLTHNGGSSEYPAVAVSGANVYILWSDDTPGNNEIYFRRSATWGTSWEAAQKLSASSGDTTEPTIAAPVGGSAVYIAGDSNYTGNKEIHFCSSGDNGASWESVQRITNTSGASGYATLACDGADVFLAWHDDTPGNYEVYYRNSTDGGATWGTAKRLTSTANASGIPDIAVNAANVYAAYVEMNGSVGDIFMKYSPR